MTSPSDRPTEIAAAQKRIAAALDAVPDTVCSACSATIMRAYSVYGGWLWLAVYGQETVPAAECPNRPGVYGVGHGPHQPRPINSPDSSV
ncbi:hypothetical protein [Nonomuraea cavernae]|uniref:Uncharacterized protein n=1 Tax=Nonomuraea cavernae TaxID=2045107 RepID=A0A917YZJ8_9ACTN|nr:hypothetical protein [Nonomuraea cavernae]MCA2190952.1 hypothetical protein [Nonomuraea cavernae]GGO70642.1 hypothetical protein GCM10012289_34520 [Nonomuraea cavernae]